MEKGKLIQWDNAVLLGEKEVAKGIVDPMYPVIFQLFPPVLFGDRNV